MNSNSFLNRVEISFLATLTSILSVADRFNSWVDQREDFSTQPSYGKGELDQLTTQDTADDKLTQMWNNLCQVILPILVWMVLGFATGFLLGMIQPR